MNGTSFKAEVSKARLGFDAWGGILERASGMSKVASIMKASMRVAQPKPRRGCNCWKIIG